MGLDSAVQLMLAKGADVDGKLSNSNSTPLIVAAGKGCVAVIRVLLEKGANVNWRNIAGATALHCASINGHETIVRMLVEKGANPGLKNTTGQTAAELARLGQGINYLAIRGFLNSLK
jgi:ankyrin repeat protein